MVITGLLKGALLVVMLSVKSTPVAAHVLPVPCDFTTGGGFVITDSVNHANFGLVAGCKHGGFYGHFNFLDHYSSARFPLLPVRSTQITRSSHPCLHTLLN